MITEDYVSFETAKLLKERGFDETCRAFWKDWNGELHLCSCCSSHVFEWCHNSMLEEYYNDNEETNIAAPTLQMVMKWLREFHGLNIYARGVWKDVEVQYGDWEPAVVGYDWFVESLTDNTYSKMSTEPFLTYEQACESAIKYCLENLI